MRQHAFAAPLLASAALFAIAALVPVPSREQLAISVEGIIGLGIPGIICPLVAFIFGWVKPSEWGIQGLMLAWTIFTAVSMAVNIMIGP